MKMFAVLKKNIFLRDITSYICRVVEDDLKIVCYVNNDVLKKEFKDKSNYTLYLYGFGKENSGFDEVIDKPIYYVFSDMVFDKGINIVTFFDAKVIFRKCTFNGFIKLLGVNDVVFENNKYIDDSGFYDGSKTFLFGYGKNLKFVNDNFVNIKGNSKKNNFGINVNFDKLEIINSVINIAAKEDKSENDKNKDLNDREIYLETKSLVIDKSCIICPYIYLTYDDIDYFNSIIKADKGIVIDNRKEIYQLSDVYSPCIVYNECDNINEKLKANRKKLVL